MQSRTASSGAGAVSRRFRQLIAASRIVLFSFKMARDTKTLKYNYEKTLLFKETE